MESSAPACAKTSSGSSRCGSDRIAPTPALKHPATTVARTNTATTLDRKSTRLNSSHLVISYAVFCLKKKIAFVRIRETQLDALAIQGHRRDRRARQHPFPLNTHFQGCDHRPTPSTLWHPSVHARRIT